MNIYTDPKGSSIGSQTFLVDDFVPDRTEFDMKSDAKAIEVGKPTPVNIEGRYLYGAPAAGLSLEGEVTLKPTRQSDDYKGYQFGLADEGAGQNASDDSDSSSSDNKAESSQVPLEDLQALDEDGKTTFDVTINDTPRPRNCSTPTSPYGCRKPAAAPSSAR